MKERPILFNGAMVRALLSGAKTHTRRVVKPQPSVHIVRTACMAEGNPPLRGCYWEYGGPTVYCPFGQPGDRLWVRETWMPGYYHEADHEDGPKVSVIHRADNAESTVAAPSYELAEQWEREFSEDGGEAPPWRPSIHMPRWASRILLEITDVRVERLQEISEADAVAEGLLRTASGAWLPGMCAYPEWAFHQLWDQVYGESAWESNPWVWVIEFKRIEA